MRYPSENVWTWMVAILAAGLMATAFEPAMAAKKKSQPPAGLDSTTSIQADSLAQQLFGTPRDEAAAQREFEKGKDDFQWGKKFLDEADSLRSTGRDTTLKQPGGLLGPFRRALGDSSYSSREAEARKRAEQSFRRAASEFENALKILPRFLEAQQWLAVTYDNLREWEKSAAVYRELLNERQGEDRLWFKYGYACLQSNQADKAVNAFEQAIRIHVLVNGDSARIPVQYLLYSGEAFARTYQDQSALARFRAAQSIADEVTAEEIQKTIDWILWDDGGIATAEHRDAAYRAENERRWGDARREYLAAMQSARTERAHSEMSHRLALLEFREFSKRDGLARMKQLMEAKTEPPDDFRESYGRMLMAYAQELENGNDRHGALGYYLQATKFPWSGQGLGFLEIARISANDLNTAIAQAEEALKYPLTAEQKQTAYTILTDAYRAQAKWEQMKYYQQLLQAER